MSFNDNARATRISNTQHRADFESLAEQVKKNVHEFASSIAALQRLVKRLGSAKQPRDVEQRVQELQESTRQLARDTAADIKELARLDAAAPTVDTQRRLLQQRLAKDFADLLQRFESVEQQAAAKERAQVNKAREEQRRGSAGALITLEDRPGDSQGQQAQRQQQQTIALDEEVAYNEQVISERERGIREIESTIVEVNAMFRDIGNLVYEQGNMLDNIESNIVSAAQQVDNGTQDLGKAQDYQKRSRNCKCYLLFILLVILLVLALIVVLARVLR
eukprot:comp20338_c0_seq1/m.25624 comp20338_c0_seq1/g.25624  ORF comp20338_c0_seq1/g.25624 comp20338_c0_seq1/m.25624 type:complete len:277 (-) comp20338_c0_seq1:978-1808(-)